MRIRNIDEKIRIEFDKEREMDGFLSMLEGYDWGENDPNEGSENSESVDVYVLETDEEETLYITKTDLSNLDKIQGKMNGIDAIIQYINIDDEIITEGFIENLKDFGVNEEGLLAISMIVRFFEDKIIDEREEHYQDMIEHSELMDRLEEDDE